MTSATALVVPQPVRIPHPPRSIHKAKPEFAFDVCHEAYRQAASRVVGIRALDATEYHDHMWRPDFRPRPKDYILDFTLAGHSALEHRDLHSRKILFDSYYLSEGEYERVRLWLGIAELVWCQWTEQIRRMVGEELLNRAIYPPKRYFGN